MGAMIPETLRALAVPMKELRPHPQNVRQGDIGAITESLRAHQQYRPLVVNKRDHTILAGNHTYAAAKALGWKEIAVTYVDVDPEEALKIMLVDNRTSDLASNDAAALAALLQSLPDLEGTGFDGDALDELIADVTGGLPLLPEPEPTPEGTPALQRSITFPDEVAVLAWDSLLETLEERDPSYKPGGRLARFMRSQRFLEALAAYHPQKRG